MNITDEIPDPEVVGEARTSAEPDAPAVQSADGEKPNDTPAPAATETSRQAQARAEKVCAMVLANGKTNGRFSMTLSALRRAADPELGDVRNAVAGAIRNNWLRSGDANRVELTAAGIYVAKSTLNLPR